MLGQIFSVVNVNLRSLPARWGSSSVVVVGIGGVVAVLVAILAMAVGLAGVFDNTVRADRAIVVRAGSDSEMSSTLSREVGDIVRNLEGVEVAAPEMFVVVDMPKHDTGTPANVTVRGVEATSFKVRPEVNIVEGTNFRPGTSQVIVGVKAQREFRGLEIGDEIEIRESTWTVVGAFQADGSAVESEIWLDLLAAQSAFRFEGFLTVVRLKLTSSAVFDAVSALMDDDPRLATDVVAESAWYGKQSENATRIIRIFGTIITIIMGIGAIFAALNTMYSAVATRTFEIATLRAMGFGGGPVVISVLAEALLLALVGGSAGAIIAYFGFNGFSVSTLDTTSFSQVAFEFTVTLELVVFGLIVSLGIGLLGGLFPAVRAARLPITNALRGE